MSQVAHALRIASTLACCIVIAAFVLWAGEQGSAATEAQAGDATAAAATAPAAPATEPEHGGARGALEDANAALLSPFDHVADGGGEWAAHAFPALLALLTYGVLARVLIPYLTADGRTR